MRDELAQESGERVLAKFRPSRAPGAAAAGNQALAMPAVGALIFAKSRCLITRIIGSKRRPVAAP